jgi:hypothetical protein
MSRIAGRARDRDPGWLRCTAVNSVNAPMALSPFKPTVVGSRPTAPTSEQQKLRLT